MMLNTCNVDTDAAPEFVKYMNSSDYNPLFRTLYMYLSKSNTTSPPLERPDLLSLEDTEIESAILGAEINQRYRLREENLLGGSSFYRVDYRTSQVTGFKITADKTLFGIASGESLNDCFALYGFAKYHGYIVSADKKVVHKGERINNMSISQYLALRPLAAPTLFLKMNRFPKELPIKVTFSVELEIDGIKTISDTCKAIYLN